MCDSQRRVLCFLSHKSSLGDTEDVSNDSLFDGRAHSIKRICASGHVPWTWDARLRHPVSSEDDFHRVVKMPGPVKMASVPLFGTYVPYPESIDN